MTREDMKKFHDTWFKPNNATPSLWETLHWANSTQVGKTVCWLKQSMFRRKHRGATAEVGGLSD
jgi:hypothetical protein